MQDERKAWELRMKSRRSFERRFGKYAIKNLSLMLIICYGFGYLFQMMWPGFMQYLYLNPYQIIFKGQVWRLVTWLIVPPSSFDFFTLLMLYFYYSIGTTLERTWGTYRYNVYIFSGVLFTIVGAFVLFGYTLLFQRDVVAITGIGYYSIVSTMFSTYYVNMSIYLAFAATFPNMQLLLFFFIPVKVKVMGIIYALLLVYQFVTGFGPGLEPLTVANRFVIGASLMNFIVFFLSSKGKVHMSPRQAKRRADFRHDIKKASKVTRHKCAVCGRTEETNPELEFRFCSKCDGNYEYCEEHLFTHTHVKGKV